MKILVHYDFDTEQQQALRQVAAAGDGHEVVFASSAEEALTQAPDCEVIMGHFQPAVCAAATRLRWVQSFSAGMDNFLFPEIVEREIVVTNMAGLYASQGGEHAWALILSLTRGIPQAVRSQDRREWRGGPAIELAGGTLGVIGLGGFGWETARRAAGYDMTVLALDTVRQDRPQGVAELRQPTPENLYALLRRADAVVIACPRTPETYHLIGREAFAAMKPTAYLINVTRGGIVDEQALANALHDGQIAGAGLDVCEQEPLPADSPLWEAPNLILTAHRAGASQHRPRKICEFFCQQLERYLEGAPLSNIVDKRKGY